MTNHKFYGMFTIVLMLFFIFQLGGADRRTNALHEHSQTARDHTQIEYDINHKQSVISHQKIVQLTNQFMDILVQDIDHNNRVINYFTKEELLEQFEMIMSKEAAMPYVDFYYEEKVDGLYIIPTETPPWFNQANDYDMMPINENQIKVTQENNSELYGKYIIELIFTYKDEWKITEVNHF